jgi:hypothetical protein
VRRVDRLLADWQRHADRVGEAAKKIFGDTEKVAPAPAKKPDLNDLEF